MILCDYQSYYVHYIQAVSWHEIVDLNEGGSFSYDRQGYRVSLVDNFGLWLTRRVRANLMSSVLLLLLLDHLLQIGFRSHSQPLRRIINIINLRSVILINFLMSHIGSVQCYISRRIKSFPSLLCASACSVVRQTEATAKNVRERKQPPLSLEGFLAGFDVNGSVIVPCHWVHGRRSIS